MRSVSPILISLLMSASNSLCAATVTEGPYAVDADSIEYNNKTDTVIANGNVVVFKNGYSLKANKMTYDKSRGKAFIRDSASVVTPSGDEIYARYLEIDTILKELSGNIVSARIGENNKFIAEKVHHYYPSRTVFNKGIYSSCPVCENHDLQWQIRSSKITYTAKEDISFQNNIFEVYGVPVLYLPYLRMAAPDAEPRSGFLMPKSYSYRDRYGYAITVPYYLRIASNKELTYSPIITTKQGVLHQADYMHLTRYGRYNVHAEYLHLRHPLGVPGNRYYLNGSAAHRLNNVLEFKANVERVSDKAYLNNYWDKNPNYLTSSVELNYIDNRDYGYLHAHGFQDLRAGSNFQDTPMILPAGRFHKDFLHESQNKFLTDFQIVNTLRRHGTDTRKSSLQLGWHKMYIVGNNEIKVHRNLRADFFNFTHKSYTPTNISNNNIHNVYRIHPELYTVWQYPLVKSTNHTNIYLMPIAEFILSPNSSSNKRVGVNDDSQAMEISDTNVFSSNRYSGVDLIEHGIRANYGIMGTLIADNGTEYNLLVGQSYKFRKSSEYSLYSGLKNKNFSDYVGRIAVKPFSFLDLYYRVRLDSDTAVLRRGELGANFNVSFNRNVVRSIDFGIRFDQQNFPTAQLINQHQVMKSLHLDTRAQINKEWYIVGGIVRSVTRTNSFPVLAKGGIGYNGSCSDFKLLITKRYTTDPSRYIFPTKGVIVGFEVSLKGLD